MSQSQQAPQSTNHPSSTAPTTTIPTTTPSSSPSSSSSPSTTNPSTTSISIPLEDAAQRTAEARTAFTASLHSVGANLDADLRARATDLHHNAAALAKQEADLSKATADLARRNDDWHKIADTARQGLKEIGDVQNWAEIIERDLLVVEETLRLVEEKDGEDHLEEDGVDGFVSSSSSSSVKKKTPSASSGDEHGSIQGPGNGSTDVEEDSGKKAPKTSSGGFWGRWW